MHGIPTYMHYEHRTAALQGQGVLQNRAGGDFLALQGGAPGLGSSEVVRAGLRHGRDRREGSYGGTTCALPHPRDRASALVRSPTMPTK